MTDAINISLACITLAALACGMPVRWVNLRMGMWVPLLGARQVTSVAAAALVATSAPMDALWRLMAVLVAVLWLGFELMGLLDVYDRPRATRGRHRSITGVT